MTRALTLPLMRMLHVPVIKMIYLKPGELCGFTTPFANPEGITPSTGDKGPFKLASELLMTAHTLEELLENFDNAVMHYVGAGMSVFVTVRGESIFEAVRKVENGEAKIYYLNCSITAYDHLTKNFIEHSPNHAHLIR